MNSNVFIPNPVKSPRIQLFVCFAHHFTMQFQVKVTMTCLQSHITFTKRVLYVKEQNVSEIVFDYSIFQIPLIKLKQEFKVKKAFFLLNRTCIKVYTFLFHFSVSYYILINNS